MRPIPPAPAPGQRILLIPAMLDAHFPLLQYPVILSQSRGLADLGLRYAHNDLCYPFVLSLGQYLQALGSGAYDLDQVSLLMPSAGDACRGSNFPSLIRKALAAAGRTRLYLAIGAVAVVALGSAVLLVVLARRKQ